MRFSLHTVTHHEASHRRRPLGGRYNPLPSRVELRRGRNLGGRILRVHRHRKP